MTATIAELIGRQALRPVFQPIVSLKTGLVSAHEAFTRLVPATASGMPPAAWPQNVGDLFERAEREGSRLRLERHTARVAIDAFAQFRSIHGNGVLFVNLSADALRQLVRHRAFFQALLRESEMSPEQLVFELTERTAIGSVASLRDAVKTIQTWGARVALDDYGTGHATLSIWVALEPDFIKIDASLVHGSAVRPLQFEALRAVNRFARKAGTSIIAEGIETLEDLVVCRDLGIDLGQGYALGRPVPEPTMAIEVAAAQAIETRAITIFPEISSRTPPRASVEQLLRLAPGVTPQTRNDDVLALFSQHGDLHALAVLEEGRPVGLINRRQVVDAYASPFHRELFGKKPCMAHANTAPLIVEISSDIASLALRLSQRDSGYLSDGIVFVDQGRYAGLGTAEDLMRAIADLRIEAARHANPLTQLPGNLPIEAHMGRLIEGGAHFYACYCDLNDFKPFNDHYGYWQGDEVLRLTAAILAQACDPHRDFLGHVGGDDFLIFFQSPDWRNRIEAAMRAFNAEVKQFYGEGERRLGGIEAADRFGVVRFHPFVTLAAGVIDAVPGRYDIASLTTLAAIAKRQAKRAASGFYIVPPETEGAVEAVH